MAISTLNYPRITVDRSGRLVAQSSNLPSNSNINNVDLSNSQIQVVTSTQDNNLPNTSDPDSNLTSLLNLLGLQARLVYVSDGQTIISFPTTPKVLGSVELFVNGIRYSSPDIVVNDKFVTWASNDFQLAATDTVYLKYL